MKRKAKGGAKPKRLDAALPAELAEQLTELTELAEQFETTAIRAAKLYESWGVRYVLATRGQRRRYPTNADLTKFRELTEELPRTLRSAVRRGFSRAVRT